MLSAIGRAAIRRAGAGAAHPSTHRVFRSVWHIRRLQTRENAERDSSSSQISFVLRRSLATAALTTNPNTKKPAKKTVKKAVKKAVKKPAKKKAVAKPKPKAKPKKVVTPEEKEKLKIKELKAVALSVPKLKPTTAWTVLMSDFLSDNSVSSRRVTTWVKEAAAKYKNLSAGELEAYNHKANQNKAANSTLLNEWITSHTPDQIRLANNARSWLKKKLGAKYHGTQLQDDRIPKGPLNDYVMFTRDRWASGDLKGLGFSDSSKLLWKEFRELPESERQAYKERAAADTQRYAREYKAAFHRDPPSVQAAATA